MTVSLIQFDFTEVPGERPVKLWCDCGNLGMKEAPALIHGINALRLFVPRHSHDCEPHVEFKP